MNAATPTGAEVTDPTKDWTVELTVVVPGSQAPTLDDAIDLLGDRLAPLYWTGRIHGE